MTRILFWTLSALALAACGAPRAPDGNAATEGTENIAAPVETPPANATPGDMIEPTPLVAADPATAASRGGIVSCATEIGAAAADRRAKICRNVSPATHPPCNAANSCAMIEDEIARSCALFDSKGPPMPGCGPAPKSTEAAVAVVRRYYSALNARDFATAWQQWGDDGQPNQTLERFETGFARTRATQVTIGTLPPSEGGAGSIYQTVPVTVDATLDDGSKQRFTGSYVVRRVNDVDGASAGQLRWHIGSARLTPVR